jgi:hypothetical protein
MHVFSAILISLKTCFEIAGRVGGLVLVIVEKTRELGFLGIVLKVGELATVVLQEKGVRVWR